ncbi:MAG: DNA-binding transcriptional LysR family regulator [Cocleimonas sp.]
MQDVKQQTSVSIAATTYVAARWLSSRISRFNEDFPEINIILQHSVNTEEFKLENADLTILWSPCMGHIDKQRFAEISMPMFPVLSSHLLKTHKLDKLLNSEKLIINMLLEDPFKNIPLLCEDRKLDTWNEWFETNMPSGSNLKLTNPRRIISDANVRVQAAIDGQGLILADDLMHNELNNQLLVAPFEEMLLGYGYALYTSPSRISTDHAFVLKSWFAANTRSEPNVDNSFS